MSFFFIAQWFRGVSSVQCFILIHKINGIVLLLVCTLGLELFRLTLSHFVVAVVGKLLHMDGTWLHAKKKCWKRRVGIFIYFLCDHVCDFEHDHL